MTEKAKRTTQYIVETAAPIFNKKGFGNTSLTDITQATGLTKGAIYGNFKNKEELALAVFNYNVRYVLNEINAILNTIDSPLAKLKAISRFYRGYYQQYKHLGGCPILNVSVNSHYNNPALFERAKYIIQKLTASVTNIIETGIQQGEINPNIIPDAYGNLLFSMIEGAIFTSVIIQDGKPLSDMMNHVDVLIDTQLRIE